MPDRKRAAKKSLISDERLAQLYAKHQKTKSDWATFVKACKVEGADTTPQGLRLRLGRWKNKGLKLVEFRGQSVRQTAAKRSPKEMAALFGVDFVAPVQK
jgi:hypothetical protein